MLVAAIAMVVVQVGLFVVMNRTSLPMVVSIELVSLICVTQFSLSTIDSIGIQIAAILISVILAGGGSFVIFKFRKLDYEDAFISLKGVVNLLTPIRYSDGRVVGRVRPYMKRQVQYNQKLIKMSGQARAGGMIISGSTGSGKTWFMRSMISQAFKNNRSVIYADMKGDVETADQLEREARSKGYEVFRIANGDAHFSYDPLENLTGSGMIEAIMNMRKWSIDGSDAHYKTGTQLVLQREVKRFRDLVKKGAIDVGDSYTKAFYRHIIKADVEYGERDAHATVTKLLELMITSSIGKMFDSSDQTGLKRFSFWDEDTDWNRSGKYLIIASFPSSNKELADSFLSLFFKDLLEYGTNHPFDPELELYVDEFGTLGNSFIIKDILEKGRSGKICTTLGVQDINQIVINTNQAYLDSILGTVNSFVVYSGATKSTAEKLAGVQIDSIEKAIMSLRKPSENWMGRPVSPTAIYISKYPSVTSKQSSEVFQFIPHITREVLGKVDLNGKVTKDTPTESSELVDNRNMDWNPNTSIHELSAIEVPESDSDYQTSTFVSFASGDYKESGVKRKSVSRTGTSEIPPPPPVESQSEGLKAIPVDGDQIQSFKISESIDDFFD